MLGCNRLCILAAVVAVIGIVAGITWGAMTGFWFFAALVAATALTYAGANYSYTTKAMGLTPKKVGITVLLVLITVAMVPIYTTAFGAPQYGAIVLAVITTLSLGWAHRTMEPTGP